MKTNFNFDVDNITVNEKVKIENIAISFSVDVNAEEIIEIYRGEKELFELLSSTVVNVVKELNKK